MQPIRPALLPLLALVLLAGCAGAPQRRPAPSPPAAQSAMPAPITAPTPGGHREGTVINPNPRAGSAYDDPSTGVTTVASAVPGAGTVTAVVLGNVALIGTTSADPAVHSKVAQQIRSSFGHIADVRFTSDPAQIGRLREAISLIQSHRSISHLLPDLSAIGNSLPAHR